MEWGSYLLFAWWISPEQVAVTAVGQRTIGSVGGSRWTRGSSSGRATSSWGTPRNLTGIKIRVMVYLYTLLFIIIMITERRSDSSWSACLFVVECVGGGHLEETLLLLG